MGTLLARLRALPPYRLDALLGVAVYVEVCAEIVFLTGVEGATLALCLALASVFGVATALRRRAPLVAVPLATSGIVLGDLVGTELTDNVILPFFVTIFVTYSAGAMLEGTRLAAAFLLVEAAGRADPTSVLADAIARHAPSAPVAVGVERGDRERLWRWREAHPEAAAALGVVLKFDVTLPAAAIAEFCAQVSARLASDWPGSTTLLYGHVGDGNIHVNVVGPDPGDDAVDDAVLDLVVHLGGSISAEHGIGVAKRAWLTRDRSASEVAAMRAIKQALDPDGIMNPGVLLP